MKSGVATNSYFRMVIVDCKAISRSFSNFVVSRVRRNVNHAAHTLAKYALSTVDDLLIEDIPSCIDVGLAFDVRGF